MTYQKQVAVLFAVLASAVIFTAILYITTK